MPVSKEIERTHERVTARVPGHVYDMLTQAAELEGATLNQFLIQSALEKAQAVIEKEHLIHISMKSAKTFFDAIENPPAPHARLIAAMKAYKNSFPDAGDSFSHTEDHAADAADAENTEDAKDTIDAKDAEDAEDRDA